MKDLELHNLVRESLHDLKPEYQPGHWRLMEAKMILAPVKFPWKIWSVAVPAAVGAAFWCYTSLTKPTPPQAKLEVTSSEQLTKTTSTKVAPLQPVEKLSVAPLENQEPANPAQAIISASTAASIIDKRPQTSPSSLVGKGLSTVGTALQLPELKTYFIEQKIRNMVLQGTIVGDSTTFKVLDRNKHNWHQAAVVCDWTSSMFPYGTQIFTWLDQNQENQSLIGYLFFNDCDQDGNALNPKSKHPGGMYHTVEKDPSKVLDVMIEAVRNGVSNSDLKENDLEALVQAQALHPDAEELVLIADNVSPVRNPNLISKIDRPVRIIICGTTLTEQAMQPIYLQLAKATGGSIHTIEDDLLDVTQIAHGKWIKVGDKYYRYHQKKQEFVETNRKKRPRQ